MKLLIWGVSNVGKTTIGKRLATLLNYNFYDIDEEIIKEYKSIDFFQEVYPNDYDRFYIKMKVMIDIINNNKNFVMAVSPIFSESIVNNILKYDIKSIEIIDTPQAIYNRLIIDGEDAFEYKERHKNHYMREIIFDQFASYQEFKDIPKVSITNQNIEESVNTVYNYLINNKNI